jgi:predicted RNA-binding protein associated with RNAse of E/G family
MTADGGVYLLDEDELSGALAKGEITQAQYDGAYEAARGIITMLERDKDALIAVCRKYFDLLKDTLA